MQPNPKAACNSPQKYTEHSLCLRTNGRSGSSKNNGEGKYTWPLPNTYTHTLKHTHTESHSFGAFHTYGKQEVHYTDGAAVGEGDTGNSILLFHSSHCTDVSQLQVQHLDCWADDL